MNSLHAIKAFAACTIVAMVFAGCSEDQSSMSINDIPGKSKIIGSLSYSEGQAYSNGTFSEIIKPADSVKVFVKVSNASLSPDGNAEGYTTYEVVTDNDGKYEIEIPAVEKTAGTSIIIQPQTFIGTRTLLKTMSNGTPEFETKDVVFSIDEEVMTVKPNDIKVKDLKYGFIERDLEAGFTKTADLSGRIGLGKFYKSNSQVYYGTRSGINVIVTIEYPETELQNGSEINLIRKFGATTDADGNFKLNIPTREKDITFPHITVSPLSFVESDFKHFDENGEAEYLSGLYKQGGYYNGEYTDYTFVGIEGVTNLVQATMVFSEFGFGGFTPGTTWDSTTTWGTSSFEK